MTSADRTRALVAGARTRGIRPPGIRDRLREMAARPEGLTRLQAKEATGASSCVLEQMVAHGFLTKTEQDGTWLYRRTERQVYQDNIAAAVVRAVTEGAATVEEVAAATGKSRSHAYTTLRRLTTTGELVAERRGQTYYYRPKEQAP